MLSLIFNLISRRTSFIDFSTRAQWYIDVCLSLYTLWITREILTSHRNSREWYCSPAQITFATLSVASFHITHYAHSQSSDTDNGAKSLRWLTCVQVCVGVGIIFGWVIVVLKAFRSLGILACLRTQSCRTLNWRLEPCCFYKNCNSTDNRGYARKHVLRMLLITCWEKKS